MGIGQDPQPDHFAHHVAAVVADHADAPALSWRHRGQQLPGDAAQFLQAVVALRDRVAMRIGVRVAQQLRHLFDRLAAERVFALVGQRADALQWHLFHVVQVGLQQPLCTHEFSGAACPGG